MSFLSFRATTCDHMIYDGACECNERRAADDTFAADLRAVLAATPTSVPYDTDAEPTRPTASDLAILGAMSLCARRSNQRSAAGDDPSELDYIELNAALAAASRHADSEALDEEEEEDLAPRSLFGDFDGLSQQANAHLADEAAADQAEQDRLREYLDDVAVESDEFLEACNACSYDDDDEFVTGSNTPNYNPDPDYYEMAPAYEGVDY